MSSSIDLQIEYWTVTSGTLQRKSRMQTKIRTSFLPFWFLFKSLNIMEYQIHLGKLAVMVDCRVTASQVGASNQLPI